MRQAPRHHAAQAHKEESEKKYNDQKTTRKKPAISDNSPKNNPKEWRQKC